MKSDPIDSRQMQIFVELANGGSLRAAASQLRITDSAISHAIRNLETNLGAKLVQRVGKSLELTENGRVFRAEAVRILGQMHALRTRVSSESDLRKKEIHIACASSFIQFCLSDILRDYRQLLPDVRIRVTPADRDSCLELLRKGKISASILCNLPQDVDDYSGIHLFDDELQVVMSADHILAEHQTIPIHKLCGQNLYLQHHHNFTSRLILNEFERRSFKPKDVTYLSNPEALRELIKMKMGVSLLPLWSFRKSIGRDNLVWRPAAGLDLQRSWYFAWPKVSKPSLAVHSLMQLFQQAAEGLEKEYGQYVAVAN